jgi:hypothetical protein
MQGAKYTVTSIQMLQQVYRDCEAAIEDHGFIKLEWKAGSNRSLDQNDLYWKWIGEICGQANVKLPYTYVDKETGEEITIEKMSKEEVHEWLKDEFLGMTVKRIGRKEVRKLNGTKGLLKGEMYFYMQQVDAWAHQKGYKLTIPDDSEYFKLKKRENQ